MDCQEYQVGRFILQPFRQLLDGGIPIPIRRKALDLLSLFAQANGALVTKDELMAAAWPNAVVEDNALQVHIASLRKLLGQDGELLRTVHGIGYRLAATPVAARLDRNTAFCSILDPGSQSRRPSSQPVRSGTRRIPPQASTASHFQPGQASNPKASLEIAYSDIVRFAKEHSPRALERLVELMESHDPSTALLAAQALLHTAYGKPRETSEPVVDQEAARSRAEIRDQLVQLVEQRSIHKH